MMFYGRAARFFLVVACAIGGGAILLMFGGMMQSASRTSGIATIEIDQQGNEIAARGDFPFLKIARDLQKKGLVEAAPDGGPSFQLLYPATTTHIVDSEVILIQVTVKIAGPTERHTLVTLTGYWREHDALALFSPEMKPPRLDYTPPLGP